MADEPFSLCLACAKDAHLKRFIEKRGKAHVRCSLCGDITATSTEPTIETELRRVVRALIRLRFDEWCYNPHWGGSYPDSLFTKENILIETTESDGRRRDLDALTDFFYDLSENPYPDRDKGVALFAGYGPKGEQNMLLRAIDTSRSWVVRQAESRLQVHNYFDVEEKLEPYLRALSGSLRASIPEGNVFVRARIGFSSRFADTNISGLFDKKILYQPHLGVGSGAPPPNLASAGRANRQGVAFLYLATDQETAAAEVRPHPGHYISLMPFRLVRPLEVADFSSVDFLDFVNSDDRLDLFHFARTVDEALSSPITPEERDRYVTTQLVADLLRRQGFDGLLFHSSVGRGKNLCLFDTKACLPLEENAKVIRVESLTYSFASEASVIKPTADQVKLRS